MTIAPAPAPPSTRILATPPLTPFIKWPGGKSGELARIATVAPPIRGRLIDPFVGGGAVLLATPTAVPAVANDASPDLIGLYRAAATADPDALGATGALARVWDDLAGIDALVADLALAFLAADATGADETLARHDAHLRGILAIAGPEVADVAMTRLARDLPQKFARMRRIQDRLGRTLSTEDLAANLEGIVRAATYMAIRARYNAARAADRQSATRLADFLFLREFAYAAMFRFNARGDFNVPYGGVTYNRKSFADKVATMTAEPMRERLGATTFRCGDFEAFLDDVEPTADDLVFVDPPYDTDFHAYDGRPFGPDDQRRLRDALERLPAAVLIVIKDTPAIRALYAADRWHVTSAAKTYRWTIKSRNDRAATHLTITNYPVSS